jgi:hypothetical protein
MILQAQGLVDSVGNGSICFRGASNAGGAGVAPAWRGAGPRLAPSCTLLRRSGGVEPLRNEGGRRPQTQRPRAPQGRGSRLCRAGYLPAPGRPRCQHRCPEVPGYPPLHLRLAGRLRASSRHGAPAGVGSSSRPERVLTVRCFTPGTYLRCDLELRTLRPCWRSRRSSTRSRSPLHRGL